MQQQYSPQRFSVLPPVIKNLLIINILVYLSTFFFRGVFGIELNDILGLRYPGASQFRFYQFITFMFAHGSFSHLFFNMFALWMFGNIIENVMGSKRFLLYYFVCGIGAALVHYAVGFLSIQPVAHAIDYVIANPSAENIMEFVAQHKFQLGQFAEPEIQNAFNAFKSSYSVLQYAPTDHAAIQTSLDFLAEYKEYYLNLPNVVGASGAIYGVLLAFGMLFPNSMIYLYFFIPMKAKWFVLAYGILELVSGFIDAGGNVAHFAHLGGMIFGLLLLLYWKKKGIIRRYN